MSLFFFFFSVDGASVVSCFFFFFFFFFVFAVVDDVGIATKEADPEGPCVLDGCMVDVKFVPPIWLMFGKIPRLTLSFAMDGDESFELYAKNKMGTDSLYRETIKVRVPTLA